MIKWNCAFQIPDATVQLDVAYIHIVSFKNVGSTCVVNIKMTNDVGDVIVKEYLEVLNKNYTTEEEIYLDLVNNFADAEVVG